MIHKIQIPNVTSIFVLLLVLTLAACGGNVSTTDYVTHNGSATLSWQPATSYLDGSPLVPAGYRIYYGTASQSYDKILVIPITNVGDTNAPSYTVTELSPGTYYFAVSVYDTSHVEGSLSNEAVKVIE